ARVASMLALGLLGLPAAVSAAVTAAPTVSIAPGQEAHGELHAGETLAFPLDVPADQALDVHVTFEGPAGRLTLRVPGQREIGAVDDRLVVVAPPSGPVELALQSAGEGVDIARYALTAGPLRPAADADRVCATAQVRLTEAHRVLEEQTAGSPAKARPLFEEAARLFEQVGHTAGRFDAVSTIGETYDNEGDMESARTYYVQALEIAKSAGDERLEVDGQQWVGLAEVHLGRMESAMANVQAALERARSIGESRRLAEVLLTLSFALNEQGRYDEAGAALREAIPIFAAAGALEQQATAHNNLGYYYQEQGDAMRALAEDEEALRLRRKAGLRSAEATTLVNIGTVYTTFLDEPEKGREYERQALALESQLDNRLNLAWNLKALAESEAKLGRHAEAVPLFEQSVALFRQLALARGEGAALNSLGQSRLALGDVVAAGAAFEEGLDRARRTHSRPGEAKALLGMARLARASGDLSAARSRAEEAIAIIEASRARVPSAELRAFYFAVVRPTYELYVDLLMRGGDPSAAFLASERSRARTLFDTLAAGRADA
ncbi:MAG TPA: tetratricopeptide repeat protein, partial [Vicinamibacteria bacterium]|nr:tetratricopeptide repeat protein [Vicinamibacteria bacterium]